MDGLFAEGTTSAITVGIDWRQLTPLFAVGGPLLPVIGYAMYWLAGRKFATEIQNLKARVKNAEAALEIAEQRVEIEKTTNATLAADIKHKSQTIAALTDERNRMLAAGQKLHKEVQTLRPLKPEVESLRAALADEIRLRKLLEAQLIDTGGENAKLVAELAARQKRLDQAEGRMKKAQRLEGYLWQAKALQKVPKFRLLSERNKAVISVLNLKGGVGKTTVTAHLGAAFARAGYRVLLVDMDLQGSLSGMMLPQSTISERFDAGRLLQHFFRHASQSGTPKITDFAVPVPIETPGGGSLNIVPTTDQLAYTEFNLNLSWLLKQGERDARFLLRKALHARSVTKAYDIVLLDCPPMLNISGINALAASDYLLVPTTLGTKAAERIPRLVKTVREINFLKHVNGQLRILGAVGNRVRNPFSGNQSVVWDHLPAQLSAINAGDVPRLATLIPDTVKIAAGEESFAHPAADSLLSRVFGNLVNEIEKGIPP